MKKSAMVIRRSRKNPIGTHASLAAGIGGVVGAGAGITGWVMMTGDRGKDLTSGQRAGVAVLAYGGPVLAGIAGGAALGGGIGAGLGAVAGILVDGVLAIATASKPATP